MAEKMSKDLTFTGSMKMLQDELATGRKPPGTPTSLPIGEYHFADRVFQPRTFEGDTGSSEVHKEELYEALLRGDPLPPILVWWGGRYWYVVDGHHRAVAYNRVALAWREGTLKSKEAPHCVAAGVAVEVFEGTLNEAVSKSAELNSRTKLPMTKRDKLERAWKLVALQDGNLSKSKIARATGVAERTVTNMRSKLDQYLRDNPSDNPLDTTWEMVSREGPAPERGEQWEERQAMKWAKALGRAFGQQPGRVPHVFARAVEIYSAGLPGRMVDAWWEEVVAPRLDLECEDDF